MEEKLLRGNEEMELAMKQEQKLLKSKAELEERRRAQLAMEQDLQQKQTMKLQLRENFSSQQEELEEIDNESQRVETRFRMTQNELDDITEIVHREREDLMDRIRELTREIRLKHLIIDQFIPAMEYMKIESRAEWEPNTNDWLIPNVEFTGNILKD